MSVQQGSSVALHYTVRLEDGTVLETTEGSEPYKIVVGKDRILPALEEALIGMNEGERKELRIPPEEAYGVHRDDLVLRIPKQSLRGGEQVTLGDMVQVSTPEGQEQTARIVGVDAQTITLDFNHPLAGKTLILDFEVVQVA